LFLLILNCKYFKMINVTGVSVNYGDRDLFDNVTFSITERDRVGLVGRNGAGKSTLLKIIAGAVIPNGGGSIARENDSTLGFLHQDMMTPKGKTVIAEAMSAFEEVHQMELRLEQINKELGERTDYESDSYFALITDLTDLTERFELLGGATAEADAERILKGLGFKPTDMQRLTEEFSGGWQMRIELAKMLLQRPSYLLLDEPTNHLDIESIVWLEGFLEYYPGAVVVISHDKQFLNNVTKRTIEIELGNIYDYKAAYSKYVEMRAERRGLQQNAYDNQQRMIAQREKTINRFMAKATKTKMAQSMQKQLDKMDRVEIDDEDVASMNIRFPPAPRSGEVVAEAKGLSKAYGPSVILDGVELKLDRGDRVSFVGQNGQGKTTLAKILVSMEPSSGGVLNVGHNVQIGYYAQNQAEALYPNMTLLETMEMHSPPEMRTKLRGILGAFMFHGDDHDKKVFVLSGGERARLALACLLLKPFNLLLLDEPTNHLDMISKEVLKQALIEYDGTLIVVSHDREFLADMTTRTIEFRDKKLYEYLGDVNFFLNKRSLDNMRDVEQKTAVEKVAKSIPNNGVWNGATGEPKDKKKIERTIQNAERRISELEAKIADIEKEMEKSNFYTRSDSDSILGKYKNLKSDLDKEVQTWELASIELEG
jgi:ATP-binding cassette, subfamily F, member 3